MGQSIVATWEPHEETVLAAIRDLGLGLQITFNKGAIMALPSGVNKASGLKAALDDLGLSPHNVVAVGDAENDHAFMQACAFSVAVANALPAVKETANLVMAGARGAGVEELIGRLIGSDVAAFDGNQQCDSIEIGKTADDAPVFLHPRGGGVLIAGSSGGGKSTLATALAERSLAGDFQICVVDTEGDFTRLKSAIVVGDAKIPPSIPECLKVLDPPQGGVVVNMLAVSLDERPATVAQLLAAIAELRGSTG